MSIMEIGMPAALVVSMIVHLESNLWQVGWVEIAHLVVAVMTELLSKGNKTGKKKAKRQASEE